MTFDILHIQNERGFSMVMVIMLTALLTVLGLVVMDAVFTDTKLSEAEKGGSVALYAAEAGTMWAQAQIESVVYAGGGSRDASKLTTTPYAKIDATDAYGCATDTCKLYGWYALTTGWVSYQGAQYRVAVSCSPCMAVGTCNTDCTSASTAVYVRTLGQTPNGDVRLLEVTMGLE